MKPSRALTTFEKTVTRVIRQIPRGKTLSYGQVALLCGVPRGARAVVRALHVVEVPWWRVIRSNGTMADEMVTKQAQRLKGEGVKVRGNRVPNEARLSPATSRTKSSKKKSTGS